MRVRRSWTFVVVALGLSLGVSFGTGGVLEAQARPVSSADLPAPELPADTEPAVTEQLDELRKLAQHALDDPDAPVAGSVGRADAVGELCRHYHAYGLTAAALSCYEFAASLAPRDFRWPYLSAYIAQGEGRHEDAIALYEKALAIVPGVSPTLVRLAAVHAELGNADRAEWLYREAIRATPPGAAADAGLGELLLSVGRAEEAAALLERALDLASEANRLYYPLAMAYRKLGDEDKARELMAWRGNVGVRPADPLIDSLEGLKTGERVFLLQGQSAFRVGRYAEAAEKFRQALEINSNSIAAWIDLGSALGEMGEPGKAITAFERAVELAPGNETALYNLGVLLSRRGQYDRAIDYLSQAGQFAPADGPIRYELAQALRLAERWQDSILHFDAAIQALPALEAPWLGKAQALARMNQQAEARATLEAGLGQIPGSVVMAQALSRILAGADDPAVRDTDKAVFLALKVFEAREQLTDAEWVAEALAKGSRCEEAADWQRRVIDQATEAQQPAAVLARLEESLGRFEKGEPCILFANSPGG